MVSPLKKAKKKGETCEQITSIPNKLEVGKITSGELSLDLSERAESISYFDLNDLA
jgi:hypothetical protein